jgi:hypothetical protein
VTPNIQKKNNNLTTFDKALRRFFFNKNIEAVDKSFVMANSFEDFKRVPATTKNLTFRKQKSIFEKKQISLTGIKGQEYPGPGAYRAPSDFGHYIS